MKRLILLMLMITVNSVFSEELSKNVEIVMTYEGGYSSVKQGEICILQKGEEASFTEKKEFYSEETEPQKKSGAVSQEKFQSLFQTLEKNNVWTLSDLTDDVATDGFTYTFQISEGQKTHTFKVYFPQLQKDPRYMAIVKAVDQAVSS